MHGCQRGPSSHNWLGETAHNTCEVELKVATPIFGDFSCDCARWVVMLRFTKPVLTARNPLRSLMPKSNESAAFFAVKMYLHVVKNALKNH